MIPDYQTLMRPVLEETAGGEIAIADIVARLEDRFELTPEERAELLPSGKQTRFANRVHWARSYLKNAGLVANPKRGHVAITDRGRGLLASAERIDNAALRQFEEFRAFQSRNGPAEATSTDPDDSTTPDEAIAAAHARIVRAVTADLLDRLRSVPPSVFEGIIVALLLKMGYGRDQSSGSILGASGDDGVDGVINQDPLGVDQVYIQAKRYDEGSVIGSGAIRDFYGALGMKDVSRGIFVTTSHFSPAARSTADKLGARIVLIDGDHLARLMIEHEVGCRTVESYRIPALDDSFFQGA